MKLTTLNPKSNFEQEPKLSRSKKIGRATDDGVFGYHGQLNSPGQCQPTRQVLTLIPTSLSSQKATSTRDSKPNGPRGSC